MVKGHSEKTSIYSEDEQLVSGCRAGDKQCQRFLFKKYKEKVFSLISHSLGSYYDKEDIFQQVFIKIFRSLDNFEGLSSLDTWVYRITVKTCIDQQRKKYRKKQLKTMDSPDFFENLPVVTGDNPYTEHQEKELAQQIYKGLNKLNFEKRMVVTMFEMEGFSLQEISEILGKPIGTIKSRLFHGRKELANHLRTYMKS